MRDEIAVTQLTLEQSRQIVNVCGPNALSELVLQRAGRDECRSILNVSYPSTREFLRPLTYTPFGVKDNIDALPCNSSGACAGLTSNQPKKAATAAKGLQVADAVVMVGLNLHELTLGVTPNNSNTGAVRSPYGQNRVAGGLSGGCAAAIANDIIPFGLGTDTGGSTRIPAAF